MRVARVPGWALLLAAIAASIAPLAALADTAGPSVSISAPGPGHVYNLFKTTVESHTVRRKGHPPRKVRVTVKRMRSLTFYGIAQDADGVTRVEGSLRRYSITGQTGPRPAPDSTDGTCTYSDGATRFVHSPCASPVYFGLHHESGTGLYRYRTKPNRGYKPGIYYWSVRAFDGAGNVSGAFTVRIRLAAAK